MSQLELWTEQDEVALQYNEQIIKDGLETYMKVGYALMEIRDNRLYRKEFKTFEEYCQEKWGRSRRWANQIIKASEVVGVLENGNNCAQIPETESQARPLTKLETPEQQSEAWSNAVANSKTGKPSAKEVDAEVKKLQEKLRLKDGEIAQLKQSNQFVSAELQRQQELMTGIEATLQDSAKSLAEKMTEAEVKKATQELRNELIQLKADKQKLESAQELAESKLKDAQEAHAQALADFKANPDPDTKKAIKEAQKALDDLLSERSSLATEVSEIQRRIQESIGVEEHRAHATGMVMSFFKKVEEVFENHHRHILSFSSLNLDDAYVAKAEDLIESLEDHIAKLKKAIADRQFNQATQVQAVEVEVVNEFEDF